MIGENGHPLRIVDSSARAVEGDPLRDVNVVIDGVRWVMKGGSVVVDKRKD